MSLALGPHLLGCNPSPPDARDWQLASFIEAAQSGDPLDLALAALLAARGPAKTTKAWASVATERLKAVSPVPTPAPPDPGPTGPPAPPEPTNTIWADPHATLNQSATPHCVGFGWTQWANTDPTNDDFGDEVGHAVYYECKAIDGQPGKENGSDVRSGAKAMQARGRLDAYAFAQTVAEIRAWVGSTGPVVLGSDWYDDMFNPDAQGFVYPTGKIAGGHCYLLAGDRRDEDAAFLLNSWGADWGLGGWFKLRWDDVRKLIEDSWGEACATIELPLAA